MKHLEDRLAPATLRWDPPPIVGTDLWSNGRNWAELLGAVWVPALRVPTANDDVEFWGTYNRDCVIPGNVVVKSINVRAASAESGADYTATVTI